MNLAQPRLFAHFSQSGLLASRESFDRVYERFLGEVPSHVVNVLRTSTPVLWGVRLAKPDVPGTFMRPVVSHSRTQALAWMLEQLEDQALATQGLGAADSVAASFGVKRVVQVAGERVLVQGEHGVLAVCEPIDITRASSTLYNQCAPVFRGLRVCDMALAAQRLLRLAGFSGASGCRVEREDGGEALTTLVLSPENMTRSMMSVGRALGLELSTPQAREAVAAAHGLESWGVFVAQWKALICPVPYVVENLRTGSVLVAPDATTALALVVRHVRTMQASVPDAHVLRLSPRKGGGVCLHLAHRPPRAEQMSNWSEQERRAGRTILHACHADAAEPREEADWLDTVQEQGAGALAAALQERLARTPARAIA